MDIMGRADNFSSGSIYPFVYLYEGTMPETMEDIPFDVNSGEQCSKNAIASFKTTLGLLPNPDQKNILEGDYLHNTMPVKKSVWDIRRQMYRVAPKYMIRYDLGSQILLERPNWFAENSYSRGEDNHNYYSEGNGLTSHNWQQYYGDYLWHNDRRLNNPNSNFYGLAYSSRTPLTTRQGIYMEYEQDVTIDAVDFWQNSNTSRTSYHVTLEYFDETAGQWVQVRSLNDPAVNTTGFNQDKEFVWTLPESVTAKKFIFSADDTGSSGWYMREVSLLSNTEPYNNTLANITWALVVPGLTDIRSGRFYENRTDSFTQQGRYPVLLCDVGGPEQADSLITVNQATDLPGFFNVTCLNLNLEFEDPGV